uniref:Calpain catalytic domain-containing protein n=1 Tax=Arcella intermedia TaxID=1963864 RepID=A0A6B2KYK4_9EUKA
MGDCYFLGALSVLATRRDLLLPLFVSARPSLGFYQCKFFKNGQWTIVTVDDRLPVNAQGKLVFAHCRDLNEFWVPIIEKAYAKLHGYYEAIESGSISAALMDLTGEASQSFDFNQGEGLDLIRSGKMWELLQQFEKEQYLMGCSCKKGGIETDTGKGILGNHAYSVLQCVQVSAKDRLLRIRNPWGCKEWTGRWSDGSKEWTTALKKKLNFEFGDDGTFFMCFEDFVDQYDNLFVCRLLTDAVGHVFQHLMFEHEWNKQSAGGCSNHDTWRNNDQWAITVPKKTDMFICLMQPDQRMLQGKEDYSASIGFNLFAADNSRKLATPDPGKIAQKCNYSPSRDVAAWVTVNPGDYVLSPTTFKPGQTMPYYLHIFSFHPVEVDLIGDGPGNAAAFAKGKWSGKTSGGCFNHQTWINNPKYLLKFGKTGTIDVEINLIQGPKATCFVGLYIFGGYQDGKGLAQNQCVKQLQCTNKNEISVSVQMPTQGGDYVIMPVTFKPGETNEFDLLIQTKEKVTLFELEGNMQALRSNKVPEVSSKNTKKPAGYAIVARQGNKAKDAGKDLSMHTPSPASPRTAPAPQGKTTMMAPARASPSPAPKPAPATKPSVASPPAPKPAKPAPPTAKSSVASSPAPKPAPKPTPKPYVPPAKAGGGGTSISLHSNQKGDVILSFGGSKKPKQNTTTIYHCGGCGTQIAKGAAKCSRCGVKLKK